VTKLSQDPEPNRLAISTHPTFAQHWLIPRIHRFQEQNPDLNIFIDPTNRLVDFSKDPVDVAIRYGEGNYDSLQSVWLMDELLYPAVHPSYQARFGINNLDDLKHGGLLEDIVPDMDWHTFFAKLGLSDPTISMMFDGSQYIVEAALAGQGVALVKHSLATRFIESKHLVRIGDKGVKSLYSYYFCTANAYKKREKVERFLSWLREEIEHFQQGQNVNLTQLRCDRESVITIPS
jgi:LysR family glycine cleavage system transcriptional activator